MRKAMLLAVALAALLLAAPLAAAPASTDATEDKVPDVPAKGMVTLVDLGAKSCIPCRMMTPILEEVEKAYAGKAAVIFIDVSKHHDQVARFGISAIPTQIFYDREGKEVTRHAGFMDRQAISHMLDKLLSR